MGKQSLKELRFFNSLLLLLFIALKLTGHINWSWWWVLSPIWMPIAVAFLIVSVILFAVFFKKICLIFR